MTKEKYNDFVRKTESLVKPGDITAISFLGDFNKYLPLGLQRRIMEKGSRHIPYMGFIVDPYCFFLSFEICDREAAEKLLPEGYELTETSLFHSGEKKYLAIISAFTARTSAFAGMRLECYLIARRKDTGRLSWIIVDYETNTNSHDPGKGFCGYSGDPAHFATTPYGELLIGMENRERGKDFTLKGDLTRGEPVQLDRDLWIEGNLTVDYGGEMKAPSPSPFSLIFDPVLMKEAMRLPSEGYELSSKGFLSHLIRGNTPVDAAFFPYAQHFIIEQNRQGQEIRTEKDLEERIGSFLNRTAFKTMSGDDIKRPLFRGMLISSLANLAIILFLLVKLLTRSG